MNIQKTIIEKIGSKITVISEYNSEFIKHAKRLGGYWERPKWIFDIRDEKKVRKICLECLGTDGFKTDLVDVNITFTEKHNERTAPIEFCGRTIARAYGRDSGATLGNGVTLESGKFTSGGSVKNWETCAENAVCIVRDLPRALVEHVKEDYDCEILEQTHEINLDDLKNEKIKLLKRIEEINKLLL